MSRISNLLALLSVVACTCALKPSANTECSYQNNTSPRGVIRINTTLQPKPIRCVQNFSGHETTTTTLRVDKFEGRIGETHFTISTPFITTELHPSRSKKKPVYLKRISPKIKMTLVSSANPVVLWLEYVRRNGTRCPKHEYECADALGCFTTRQVCDGVFDCRDHSDETSCGGCVPGLAPCSSMDASCFDPATQRCDGALDCPFGEDEIGCVGRCKGTIACPDSDGCFERAQRCDGWFNCPEGFDEDDCHTTNVGCPQKDDFQCQNGMCIDKARVGDGINDCDDATDEIGNSSIDSTLVISATVGIILSIGFLLLLYRWYSTRRNIDLIMENPLEIPLPPFLGPGESYNYAGYELQFSESDFMHGGEIYEAFVRTRRRLGQRRRRVRRHHHRERHGGRAVPVVDLSGGDCDSVALASLGVRPETCIGLSKEAQEKLGQRMPEVHKQDRKRQATESDGVYCITIPSSNRSNYSF